MNIKNTTPAPAGFIGYFKAHPVKTVLSGLAGGAGMWVVGGLWHNLILPLISPTATAHHDGLALALIAYFLLAFCITYFYLQSRKNTSSLLFGAVTGIVVGFVWVFPHGLVQAGAHDTSVIYEIKNGLYHLVEQGIGGLIAALFLRVKTEQ